MGLVDPVKVYAASSSVEAQMICSLLKSGGLDAFACEELSPAGIWGGGPVPGLFDAGVYVSRADGERAIELIPEHEQLERERASSPGTQVEATCEECGKKTAFPAAQRGTVQYCPHCGELLDVGKVDLSDVGEEGEAAEDGIQPAE